MVGRREIEDEYKEIELERDKIKVELRFVNRWEYTECEE